MSRNLSIWGYKTRHLTVLRLLTRGENHAPVSVVAQSPVLLPKLSAVGKLIHPLRAKAMGEFLSDDLHGCQRYLLLANDILIALVEIRWLSVRHELIEIAAMCS